MSPPKEEIEGAAAGTRSRGPATLAPIGPPPSGSKPPKKPKSLPSIPTKQFRVAQLAHPEVKDEKTPEVPQTMEDPLEIPEFQPIPTATREVPSGGTVAAEEE